MIVYDDVQGKGLDTADKVEGGSGSISWVACVMVNLGQLLQDLSQTCYHPTNWFLNLLDALHNQSLCLLCEVANRV